MYLWSLVEDILNKSNIKAIQKDIFPTKTNLTSLTDFSVFVPLSCFHEIIDFQRFFPLTQHRKRAEKVSVPGLKPKPRARLNATGIFEIPVHPMHEDQIMPTEN